MDTKELIERVANRIGRSGDDTAKLVEGLSIVLRERLSDLDSIAIPGFGTFEAKKKDERIVNNPSNGKRMLVPPRIVVGFKVSNVLKSKLK
ncbi:MAG: HU family DNA-binding protein [Muribaculaceae bacterium]